MTMNLLISSIICARVFKCDVFVYKACESTQKVILNICEILAISIRKLEHWI